jgi:hypothetical protein
MNIEQLSDKELNSWVAKGAGLAIIGEALLSYCPESGTLQLDYNQKATETGIMKTHKGDVYLRVCQCDFLKECEQRDEEFFKFIPQRKLLGHDYGCLEPVANYCTDVYEAMEIIKQYRISIVASELDEWTAFRNGCQASSTSLLKAAMKVFVKSQFGEQFE